MSENLNGDGRGLTEITKEVSAVYPLPKGYHVMWNSSIDTVYILDENNVMELCEDSEPDKGHAGAVVLGVELAQSLEEVGF